MPCDLKWIIRTLLAQKQFKATLISSVCITPGYIHTWKHTSLFLFVTSLVSACRGQDPTSWPANYNPALANCTSRSAPQITVGTAPRECWGQGGRAVSGGNVSNLVWPCLMAYWIIHRLVRELVLSSTCFGKKQALLESFSEPVKVIKPCNS